MTNSVPLPDPQAELGMLKEIHEDILAERAQVLDGASHPLSPAVSERVDALEREGLEALVAYQNRRAELSPSPTTTASEAGLHTDKMKTASEQEPQTPQEARLIGKAALEALRAKHPSIAKRSSARTHRPGRDPNKRIIL